MPAKGWVRAHAAVWTPPPPRFGLPPEPWPDIPDGYAFGEAWGPPGTVWTYDEHSAISRAAEHGHPVAWIIEHLPWTKPFIDGSGSWEVPLRFARCQVHAKLGTSEEVIHSLNFRLSTDDSTVNGAALAALATKVGQQIQAFITDATIKANFSSELSYDEVRVSWLQQTSGTDKDGKGGDLSTLIPTIVVPLSAPTAGFTTDPPLPYEVAMALSLNTDTRGPSNRGRVYLGGLTPNVMGSHGNFDSTKAAAIAATWGVRMVGDIHDSTAWRANIVSRRHASAREIQGVAVGVVPDSQRRRRDRLSESTAQAWGTPAGMIPA